MEAFYPIGPPMALTLHGNAENQTIRVKILDHYTQSCSVTMRVEIIDHPQGPGHTAFLKLYDRRFATGIRSAHGETAWTAKKEKAFLKFVQDKRIDGFLDSLAITPQSFLMDTLDSWTAAEGEAFLHKIHQMAYEDELAVYQRLELHQGINIPKLLGTVEICIAEPPASATTEADKKKWADSVNVRGLLLEHIPGCSLWQLPEQIPRSGWQGIVDRAIDLLEILDQNNIVNFDTHPTNFMVFQEASSNEPQYQIYMIDFGYCEFRKEGQSDEEWRRAKCLANEAGGVGSAMRGKLVEYGFELRLNASMRSVTSAA